MFKALQNPLLLRELRGSSRRSRYYWLRAGYLALLMICVLAVYRGSIQASTLQGGRDRMAETGRTITVAIVWFNFVAAHVIMLVSTSVSINGEVRARTLGVLLASPIPHLQILLGKLAAKLLHVVTLLACSLPLLMLVRIFGGVPWDFVVAATLVTLAGAAIAGAIGLLFSAAFSQAFTALAVATLVLLAEYAVMFFFAPAVSLFQMTWNLMSVGPAGAYWLRAGLVFLGAPLVILPALFKCRKRLGKLAYTKPPSDRPLVSFASPSRVFIDPYEQAKVLRQMAREGTSSPKHLNQWTKLMIPGCPVLWRECQSRGSQNKSSIRLRIGGAAFLGTVYLLSSISLYGNYRFHAAVISMAAMILAVGTACLLAMSVTAERQNRTWEVLLSTPLESFRVALSKAKGVLYRLRWLGCILLAHLAFYTIITALQMPVLLFLALPFLGLGIFATGLGLFVGACMRQTALSVLVALAVLAGVTAIGPGLAAWFDTSTITFGRYAARSFTMRSGFAASPLGQIHAAVSLFPGETFITPTRYGPTPPNYPRVEAEQATDLLLVEAVTAAVLGGAGVCMFLLAVRRFRSPAMVRA